MDENLYKVTKINDDGSVILTHFFDDNITMLVVLNEEVTIDTLVKVTTELVFGTVKTYINVVKGWRE